MTPRSGRQAGHRLRRELLDPDPFARAIITKSAPGMSAACATEQQPCPVLRPDRIAVDLGTADDRAVTPVRGSNVRMSPSRDKATRPFPAGPNRGGSFGASPASTRPAARAPTSRSSRPTARHGGCAPRAVGRSRASGATFHGGSRPAAGACVRSARRGRRSSRASARRRAHRGVAGCSARCGRSCIRRAALPGTGRRVRLVAGEADAHEAERPVEPGLGCPERDPERPARPPAAASRGSSA